MLHELEKPGILLLQYAGLKRSISRRTRGKAPSTFRRHAPTIALHCARDLSRYGFQLVRTLMARRAFSGMTQRGMPFCEITSTDRSAAPSEAAEATTPEKIESRVVPVPGISTPPVFVEGSVFSVVIPPDWMRVAR